MSFGLLKRKDQIYGENQSRRREPRRDRLRSKEAYEADYQYCHRGDTPNWKSQGQSRSPRDRPDHEHSRGDQRSLRRTDQLQDKISRQKHYDDVEKQMVEALANVLKKYRKSTTTSPTSEAEAVRQKPNCPERESEHATKPVESKQSKKTEAKGKAELVEPNSTDLKELCTNSTDLSEEEAELLGPNSTDLKKLCTRAMEGSHGVIYSMMIKEKEPDSPQFFSTRERPVSRTKLFQEEGLDTIFGSPEKIHVPSSAQTKIVLNSSNPTTTWTTVSPHLEHVSKRNQSNPSSGKEVIQLSNQVNPSLRDLDRCAFNGGLRPNQKELNYEMNCSRMMIHQSNRKTLNHLITGLDVEVIDFTSRRICSRHNCPTRPEIESHSPIQVRSSYETSWRMFINLLCFQRTQDHRKWTSDQRDPTSLPKRVELVLCLKNARSTWFESYQTYVWHPGTSKPSPE